jgi:hypothetical protein
MLHIITALARWLISFNRSRSRKTRGERSSTETGNPSSKQTSSMRRDKPNFFSAAW